MQRERFTAIEDEIGFLIECDRMAIEQRQSAVVANGLEIARQRVYINGVGLMTCESEKDSLVAAVAFACCPQ